MIKQAYFTGSFTTLGQCPADGLPEYAFIGRSNVGKSSLINKLTGRRQLAKVSNTPGKTKTLNYFRINDSWYLVDLPGYGYAKVSRKERFAWDRMIRAYLANRTVLSCVFVLIDPRIPPQQSDLEFIDWLGSMSVPFAIIFTKADKIKGGMDSPNIAAFLGELEKSWESLPTCFLTSSVTGQGRDEVLAFIEDTNKAIAAAAD